MYIWMCIAALFLIVRNWKQSTCSSMDDWLNKLQYVHSVGYCSTIKWNRTVKNLPALWRPGFDHWVGKIPGRRTWPPTPVLLPGESPWAEEPGGLQSMGSQRVGHDWATEHSTQQWNGTILLIHTTTWVDLKDTTLCDKYSQKVPWPMDAFRNILGRNYGNGKQVTSWQEQDWGEEEVSVAKTGHMREPCGD